MKWTRGKIIALCVLGALPIIGLIVYFNTVYSVDEAHLLVITNKMGDDLSNEEVLAPDGSHKGITQGGRREGRHFLNPITTYWTSQVKALEVPSGKIAILTRLYGKNLPAGQILVDEEKEGKDLQKGILPSFLQAGRHYLNPYEYTHKFINESGQEQEFVDIVTIPPGHRGVVTRLYGKEPENPNVFVVKDGERGTQPFLLPEGSYPEYSNPFVFRVIPIDVRSRKFEMSGNETVSFISNDGFRPKLGVAVEWAPMLEGLPELFVKYYEADPKDTSGGMDSVEGELIRSHIRSFLRIEGGKHSATAYITGGTRIAVQNQVESQLKTLCAKNFVEIRSFVILKPEPDPKLQEQFARRELAARQIDQFQNEINTEIGEPVLIEKGKPVLGQDGKPLMKDGQQVISDGTAPLVDKQGKVVRKLGGKLQQMIEQRRKERESALGEVRKDIAGITREADQYSMVKVTEANQKLEVARLRLKAAQDKAAATKAAGLAKADVVVMQNQANAAGIKQNVAAFGSGEKYADFLLITKFAPAVQQILSNTDGPFAEFFLRMMNSDKPEKK